MAKPDRLYLDVEDIKFIDDIIKETTPDKLNFKEAQNKEIFILAMAIGESAGGEGYEINKKKDYVLDKYLSDEDQALINSIAINRFKDVEIILEKDRIYSYAQQCAHLGIKILRDEILDDSYGSFENKMLAKLNELYEELIKL